MFTNVVLEATAGTTNAVDDIVAQARRAHSIGVSRVWLPQRFAYDAISLAGLVGAAVPGLRVGTFVVPINPRHPLVVATLSQTAQAAAHGNLTLGLGLGSHGPERAAYGIAWSNPVARLEEYLTVLRSVFDTGTVHHHGPEFTADPVFPVALPGGTPVPIYVAAMGPRALRVAGKLADGVLPHLAGPRTLAEFIVPTLEQAAAEAGRPRPHVVASVPVLITDDLATAHAAASEELAFYQSIPSYATVIAREGVEHPVDLAAIGTIEAVSAQLRRYRDTGVTEIILNPLGAATQDPERLWELAASL